MIIKKGSRVVAEDGVMTDEQKDIIAHLLPLNEIKQLYNPKSIDPKNGMDILTENILRNTKDSF